MEYIPPEILCDIFSRVTDIDAIDSLSFTSKETLNLARNCIVRLEKSSENCSEIEEIPVSTVLLYPNVLDISLDNYVTVSTTEELVRLAQSKVVKVRILLKGYELGILLEEFDSFMGEYMKYHTFIDNIIMDNGYSALQIRQYNLDRMLVAYRSYFPDPNKYNVNILGVFDVYIESHDIQIINNSNIHTLILSDLDDTRYVISNTNIKTLFDTSGALMLEQLELPNLENLYWSKLQLKDVDTILRQFPRLSKIGFYAEYNRRSIGDLQRLIQELLRTPIDTIVLYVNDILPIDPTLVRVKQIQGETYFGEYYDYVTDSTDIGIYGDFIMA